MNSNHFVAPAEPAGSDPQALAAALREPNPFVRAQALGQVQSQQSLELVAGALRDDYPLVRREAVRALGRIGGADAASILIQASAHDLAPEVREEAVAALARMLRMGSAADA